MIAKSCGVVVIATMLVAPVRAHAEPTRPYDGTRDVGWSNGDEGPAPAEAATTTKRAPAKITSPRVAMVAKDRERIAVAVGLSPAAPGNRHERDLLQRLQRSVAASPSPKVDLRRLRPGVGDGRQICRDRRDDLVLLLGYVPDRDEPVVLTHDCRLDAELPVRPAAAVDEPGLVGVLWDEHHELVQRGAKERRLAPKLTQRARIGIVAGVAAVLIGVAVGLIVANALRKEKVVLKVEP